MTLPFLAECCQATSSKSLVQLSTATVSSECDWLSCPEGAVCSCFPEPLVLSTSSSVTLSQPWRRRLIKVVLFGDWAPHRHLFSAPWLNLKVFFNSPWKEGFRLEGALSFNAEKNIRCLGLCGSCIAIRVFFLHFGKVTLKSGLNPVLYWSHQCQHWWSTSLQSPWIIRKPSDRQSIALWSPVSSWS